MSSEAVHVIALRMPIVQLSQHCGEIIASIVTIKLWRLVDLQTVKVMYRTLVRRLAAMLVSSLAPLSLTSSPPPCLGTPPAALTTLQTYRGVQVGFSAAALCHTSALPHSVPSSNSACSQDMLGTGQQDCTLIAWLLNAQQYMLETASI